MNRDRRHDLSRAAVLAIAILLVLTTLGCAQKSPEEQVADLRGQYTAELVSWRVEQTPAAAEVSEGAEDGSEAEGGGEVEVPEHLATNLINDIFLDILVGTSSAEVLDGLTVDVTHAAATQAEKQTFRVFLDTSGITKGAPSQITAKLENVESFEEGDLFSVEIRNPSADQRGDYAEFAP